ncbi:TetR family transcriptional regulator [Actinocorallia sp. API 0066]|uniref:TetR/AcrR family transcriptional regulator n=1 Tax=Actinocorallia sp. API 0066 TaxID=2896846 RepID=UPI001E4E1E51|nr:TetR family transcriptional regulator [Actinocorallia sp. API 0066]MCD0452460.1 TetR family transcriptional regulator [Actinocorallia sp. API 0066]
MRREPCPREPGLRERKKSETRQLISDVATGLFLERGFDEVTVVEVAAAANVSAKTVFNYFPRKEDLFLDRFPDLLERVAFAVRERPEGVRPLAALRAEYLRMLGEGDPLTGFGDANLTAFREVVAHSPALQGRVREFVQELEDLLSVLFAEASGLRARDPDVRVAAVTTAGVLRTVHEAGARLIAEGVTGADLAGRLAELADRLFHRLGKALDEGTI